MEELTFVLNPEKQTPSVQLWLEEHEYASGEDGILTTYYRSECRDYCHLIVNMYHYAFHTPPYPEVFHILENRFGWGNGLWFHQAFGQVFELSGEQGEHLWIANSLNIDMNELRIDHDTSD